MGKDCGSRFHHQYPLLKLANLKFTSAAPYQQKFFQLFTNPYSSMVSTNGPFPGMAAPSLPHLKRSQGKEEWQNGNLQPFTKPHACVTSTKGSLQGLALPGLSQSKTSQEIEEQKWFNCLPYHCESASPLPDTVLKGKLSTLYKCDVEATTNTVPKSLQKRFLVFDQSSNGTNLIFSSSVACPAQNLNSANAAAIDVCGPQKKQYQAERNLITQPWPVIYDGLDENQKTSEESEMHEDTEELDALLYSDASDSDDEETSTAHSPNEVTGRCKRQEEIEEISEEVTSCIGPTKRKRLPDEEDEQSSLRDTACSLDLSGCEDDAESSCVSRWKKEKTHFSEASKRVKRERIWDTVSILQGMIPGAKGKDTALILDEAVQYLRFLQLKAKSLGVAIE